MSILQLNPSIPVFVEGKGTGYAFAIIDYSQEHFIHFIVGMDETGDIWVIDNKKVKLQKNISLNRTICIAT